MLLGNTVIAPSHYCLKVLDNTHMGTIGIDKYHQFLDWSLLDSGRSEKYIRECCFSMKKSFKHLGTGYFLTVLQREKFFEPHFSAFYKIITSLSMYVPKSELVTLRQ